jgi:hypothetical protein
MLVVPILNSSISILVLRCLDLVYVVSNRNVNDFIYYILLHHFHVCFGTALYVENVSKASKFIYLNPITLKSGQPGVP